MPRKNKITAAFNMRVDGHTSTAYGYGRVSHIDSFKEGAGDSVPSQQGRIEAYYKANLEVDGVKWGGFDDDQTNISAFKVPFEARPAGKRLLAIMKPGDHLILDKVDRIWRSSSDFVHLMENLENKQITVHIVNLLGQAFKNNSAMGEFMLKLFVLFAELDSTIKSERTREAIHQLRVQGRRTGKAVPPGCKFEYSMRGDRKITKVVWDPPQLALLDKMVAIIDSHGHSWKHYADEIEDIVAEYEKREPIYGRMEETTHRQKCQRLYIYRVAYTFLGIREPSQIPARDTVYAAAQQHRLDQATLRQAIKGVKSTSTVPRISAEELLAMDRKMR